MQGRTTNGGIYECNKRLNGIGMFSTRHYNTKLASFLTYAFCFLGMDNLGLFAEHPAVTNGSGWTITDILNQTLPEHRTLSEAKLLLEPLLADHKHKRCRNYRVGVQLKGSVVAESQVDIPRKHHVGALPSIQKLSIPTTCSGFRGHALSVWEDKYRMRCLEVEDVLFLIAHPHVATTLESASFLRRAQLTFDQIMELEMTLAMLRQQKGWNNVKPLSENAQASAPLCIKLARNAWAHGRAFKSLQSRKIVLPEVTVCKGIPPRFTKLGLTKPANVSQLYTLPHNHEKSLSLKEHVTTRRSADLLSCPPNIREWIRDHCMEEVALSQTIRKRFAVEKVSTVFSRFCYQAKRRRFVIWHQQAMWLQCYRQTRHFCQLKCALWVLQNSRSKLQAIVFRSWSRWMLDVVQQREDETIAAAIVVQSWMRAVKGKRTAAIHHLHQAATLIQANWRGFYSRKMLTRKNRFAAYNKAAHQIQRYYHSYIFRVRCDVWMKQQLAARIITRCIARYIEKKRDFLAWCHHLARYHAAISIQIWMRRTRRRIARAKSKRDKMENAQQVIVNFFCYAGFVRCFRADLARKTAAAVLLQNAYRAKQARARFYELKVRLEDQRRQEILTFMWNNAYATTIQQWWRKCKRLQQQVLRK